MAPRSTSGFTLIELMIVVVITGVLLSYAVPGFSRSMADKRASNAVSEILRIARRARAAAESKQPAHLLVIQAGGTVNQTGQVRLLRGQSARCDRQNWLIADQTCPPVNRPLGTIEQCPEFLNLDDATWFHDPFAITLRSVANPASASGAQLNALLEGAENATTSICFESSGSTYWTATAPATNMVWNNGNVGAAAGGGFLYTVGAVANGSALGVARMLLLPLGTSPRRVR